MTGSRVLALTLSLFAGALVALAGAPAAFAQGKTAATLLLNFYTYGEHAALAYGVAKGIYAEEGIDLTLKEGAGSGATVNAIIGDSARFGYADAGTMARATTKDAPLKMIANYVQTSPFSIIFFADKGFKSPKDLVGKKVSFTAGDSLHQAWPALLKVNGIDRTQVQEVLLAAQAKQTAVMTGTVDAMGGYYTTQAGAIERETKKKVAYLRYADFGVNPMTQGIFIHTKYAGDRALNCKMVRATTRAWLAAGKDPDGAVEALHQLFPNTNKGAKDLTKQQWTDSYDLLYSKHSRGKTAGWMAQEDWDALIKLLAEYGGLEKPRPVADYYTNEAVDCK
ncbi:MAG: ABC transporter substrate-binding protein [Candidatus Rokubacteria bacterium]|nr:ABC transporter substrate-binding protein [Candidatus Rokubacteria bacterium]